MSLSPTPSVSPSPIFTGINPSIGALILASIALIVLLSCVIVAFIFGRKLQASYFDRQGAVIAIAKNEELKRVQQLDKHRYDGPIDCEKNPLPVEVGGYNAYYFWTNQTEILNLPETAPDNKEEVDKWTKLHELQVWGEKEVIIWRQECAKIEKTSKTDEEKRNRIEGLDNRAHSGPLNPNDNPYPTELGDYNTYYFWKHQSDVINLPDSPPNNQSKISEWQRKHALKLWGQKECRIYEQAKKDIEAQSLDEAKHKVPLNSYVARSGGFTFILEFCTIVVIIFTLVILGILGILPGNEITAVLAAIAGYVLGRAATASQVRSKPEKEPEPKKS